jgi:hypothetical protein
VTSDPEAWIGDNVHARVAIYRIKSGTAGDIACQADAEGGILGIFRAHVGFDSYEPVGSGDTLISISPGQSAEQADTASLAALLGRRAPRCLRSTAADHVGELVLSVSTPDAVGL